MRPFRVKSVPVLLRQESKRGLIALAVLFVLGLATFAVASSSASSSPSSSGGRTKDATAARLDRAR
jgi:hypothetical protein